MQEFPSGQRAYDLEERALRFAQNVRHFVKKLPPSIANTEDSKQLIRSSGAVGANYIEANQSLGKRDFIMRAKIAKKEARESYYWLQVIDVGISEVLQAQRKILSKEADELTRILGAMVRNALLKV